MQHDILRDTSPDARVAALEANVTGMFERYSAAPGTECAASGGFRILTTGVRDAFFNGVTCSRAGDSGGDAGIDAVFDHFRSRNLPFHWGLMPSSLPLDLASRLERRRPTLPLELPGMTMNLSALPSRMEPLPDVRIEEVKTRTQLEAWVNLGCKVFEMAADPATVVALEAGLGLGTEFPGRRFLAFIDDRPAATSLLLLAGGVAGIYWVATSPEARGRGLGRLMTAYPLFQARELGYRAAVLQSSQMAYGMYRKLGFDDCCQTCLLMWC